MTQMTRKEVSTQGTLYFAIEMSEAKWLLAFRDGMTQKVRHRSIKARDLDGLRDEITMAKAKLGLAKSSQVESVYEAGRDGFWLHRWLCERGIGSHVLDPSSLQVDRRFRRVKTDKLDAKALVAALIRWMRGETDACRMVRVLTSEQEDARRDARERDRLLHEETGHRARIRSLLALHGVSIEKLDGIKLDQVRTVVGQPLPERIRLELEREKARLQLVQEQRKQLEKARLALLRAAAEAPEDAHPLLQKVLSLMAICGVGEVSAWHLVFEFFFRDFKNRRQVGSAAGLTNAPYDTGNTDRDQGITKAGNARIRSLMVELSWMWLRYQPHSELATWFHSKFGKGKRTRRVGIVALARRLLVALWQYLEKGIVPKGAKMRAAA